MNTFDIIIASLLLFGFIRGIFKGLFVEIASLLALVAGVYGAIHFSYFVGNFLAQKVSWDEKFVTLISFTITFAIIVLVIALIGKLLTKIADFASLGLLNKILGGLFGLLKIALILSVVLIVFSKLNNTIPFVSSEDQKNAVLFEPIKKLAPTLFPNFLKVDDDLPNNHINSTSN
jgi:membrane protein required for colicin V production